MNLIDELPNLDWSEIAKAEIALQGADLIRQSHVAVQVGQVAIAGLAYYAGFTSPPLFWFALARGVTIRDLIDFRRLKDSIPRGSLTAINMAEPTSIRFAKLYGFEDIGFEHVYKGLIIRMFRRV